MMALKENIARLLYPYGSTRSVLRGPARGLRYVVREGVGLTYALGTDAANFHFLARHVKAGATVFDIGANRGQTAFFFARHVGAEGQVISFEPVPSVFDDLEQNLRMNGLSNVRPVRIALSDSAGEATLCFNPDRSTIGSLKEHEPTYADPEAEEVIVQTTTLDSLMADGYPIPDVLKVDVEGAAAAVFRGAADLLSDAAPAIYVELHGLEEKASIKEELQSRGYVIETMKGRRVADPTSHWFSPLWCYKE